MDTSTRREGTVKWLGDAGVLIACSVMIGTACADQYTLPKMVMLVTSAAYVLLWLYKRKRY